MEEKVYKSGCEVLRGISLEMRNRIISNIINGNHNNASRYLTDKGLKYLSVRHLISGGFTWCQSVEGSNYWYEYNKKLKLEFPDEG